MSDELFGLVGELRKILAQKDAHETVEVFRRFLVEHAPHLFVLLHATARGRHQKAQFPQDALAVVAALDRYNAELEAGEVMVHPLEAGSLKLNDVRRRIFKKADKKPSDEIALVHHVALDTVDKAVLPLFGQSSVLARFKEATKEERVLQVREAQAAIETALHREQRQDAERLRTMRHWQAGERTSIVLGEGGGASAAKEQAAEQAAVSVDLVTRLSGAEQKFVESFASLSRLAAAVRHSLDEPELVFVGARGSGKSTLIDAFVGHTVTSVAPGGGGTRRPLHVHLCHNADVKGSAEPIITLQGADAVAAMEQGAKDKDKDKGKKKKGSKIAGKGPSGLLPPTATGAVAAGGNRSRANSVKDVMQAVRRVNQVDESGGADVAAEDGGKAKSRRSSKAGSKSGSALGRSTSDDLAASVAGISPDSVVVDTTPVEVTIEHASFANCTIIDCPGLVPGDAVSYEMSLTAARPAKRIVVAVEETAQWVRPDSTTEVVSHLRSANSRSSELRRLLAEVDPHARRTVVAHTKFDLFLFGVRAPEDLASFFQLTPERPRHRFFVGLLPFNAREKCVDNSRGFVTELARADATCHEYVRRLGARRSTDSQMGLGPLLSHLRGVVRKAYAAQVPAVQAALRADLRVSRDKARDASDMRRALGTAQARSLFINASALLLRSVQRLLDGTANSVGSVHVDGQTMEQERLAVSYEDGGRGWETGLRTTIRWDAISHRIPFAECKLCGGAQLNRLLAEFRAVASSVELTVDPDEVVTAGHAAKTDFNKRAWEASDLAQRKLRSSLTPLVMHLLRRCSYIVRRMPAVAKRHFFSGAGERSRVPESNLRLPAADTSVLGMVGTSAGALAAAASAGGSPSAASAAAAAAAAAAAMAMGSVNDDKMAASESAKFVVQCAWPQLMFRVTEEYETVLSWLEEQTRQACLDEFATTQLMFWEEFGAAGHVSADMMDADGHLSRKHRTQPRAMQQGPILEEQDTLSIATQLFASTRDRIVKSVMLKVHHRFVYPAQQYLCAETQSRISYLSDSDVNEMLELTHVASRLERHTDAKEKRVAELYGHLSTLVDTATGLRHPELHETARVRRGRADSLAVLEAEQKARLAAMAARASVGGGDDDDTSGTAGAAPVMAGGDDTEE